MNVEGLIAIISVASALTGIAVGWTGKARTARQDIAQQASADTNLKVDVEYIKRGVDDIRAEQRSQGKEIEKLAERVTRVEESAKQAHKRLDRIDGEN
ncbi:hypothetical protein [Brevibacillus nitrificans]|uniref:hypothetical protein n=1 Tax=Brevibacillus nitrificans TaxID=651560 RepID=UPI002863FBDA|nr:hypothetical protein [Brevibacillus nitrificans]MDR7318932.1 peptidoglycan hydrolase CwlO-like protein [Brevibacillus nitrificans]